VARKGESDQRFLLSPDPTNGPFADPKNWLPDLLPKVAMDMPAGTTLYRARANPSGTSTPFPAEEMGAPPEDKAVNGRVNPVGIQVLYAAMERKTAVSEIRPGVGMHVSLAALKTKKDLRLIDLASLPVIPNPFGYAEDDLAELIRENGFLRCLNRSLSRPVQGGERDIEYIPTQYVAEVIRNEAFDGIIFGSSLAESGKNVVLFNPDVIAIAPAVEIVSVNSVTVDFEALEAAIRSVI
jgi:hypothetical protein